jgi:peroxiredoxin Q/BCP
MKVWRSMTLGALALSILSLTVVAQNAPVDLKVGDKAPDFTATDDTAKQWKLSDHVGKKLIVVYFYPADFTGGCTAQACSFRDDMGPLTEKGVEVVGISGDSVENHKLFKTHHKLNFTLLADEQGEVAKKFGVPVNKGGEVNLAKEGINQVIKRGVTIQRWTFVIGKDGTIIYKNPKVNAAEDSKQILELVKKIGV